MTIMSMKSKIYLAAALALILAACNKNRETVVPEDGTVAAKISAEIGGVRTRAAGNEWAQNDVIGISTVDGTKTLYANIPYKYSGTAFQADGAGIYFQSREEVTFNAYYPFTGAAGTSAGTIAANTGTENQSAPAQACIDFLFAAGAKAKTDSPVVAFTDKSSAGGPDNSFKHRMSQITLKLIEGDDMTFADKLSGYTIKGLLLDGTFDRETGIASVRADSETDDLSMPLSDVTTTEKTYTTAPVILFPQAVSNEKIVLEVVVDGITYTASLSLGALDAGSNYIFPVTVRKTGMSAGEAEITPWTIVEGAPADAIM